MIIPIDTEKVLYKIQNVFVIKNRYAKITKKYFELMAYYNELSEE